MLLTITAKRRNATELGYLLHKHPGRFQSIEMPAGQAHIFYPVATEEVCTICLFLDIDPVKFARKNQQNRANLTLAHYVNDRPYVASSFLSVAIAKAFSTAMNGHCKYNPDLVEEVMSLEVSIAVLPAPRGGAGLIRSLFEPLGYSVSMVNHPLDDRFPEWGDSKYFTVSLCGSQTIKALLSHLYVLIPALDREKHYWISEDEVEKLLQKGKEWLATHPSYEQIVNRYLKNLKPLTRLTKDRLTDQAEETGLDIDTPKEVHVKRISLHEQRLDAVLNELIQSGAKSVLDLGCGEGKLLKRLMKQRQFQSITGMDIASRSLENARENLRLERMPGKQLDRIQLINGSLTYRDDRLMGYDAAAIVEVIEHMDEERLPSFEQAVFAYARPKTVILTTPNRTYNQLFENMSHNSFRHADHRFEWTEEEFSTWAQKVAKEHGYEAIIKPLGDLHTEFGPPSQMAVFTQLESQNSSK
ncbi:MAG: 3' terminal RNA ribose 2'-O-methyltransferase Hen1 [Bacteroidota bacterium]